MKKEMKVEVGKRDNIINVAFDAPSPQEALDVVNSVLDSYRTYREEHTKSKADFDLDGDRHLQKDYDAKIEALMKQMSDFKVANHAIDLSGNFGNITREKLNSLSTGLAIAQREAVEAKADYDEAMKSINDDPEKVKQLAELVDTATPSSLEAVVTLKKELAQMDQQLQDLERQHFLSAHPQVVGLQRKIDELNLRFGIIAKKRWEAAQLKEAALRVPYEQEHKKAEDLDLKANQYAIMDDNLKRLRDERDLLQQRVMRTSVNRDQGAHNIDIFEVTNPDKDKPTWPRGSVIMAAALVLGSISGIGLARIREWIAPRLHNADDVQNALGLPILACIPHSSAFPLDDADVVADEYSEPRETLIAITTDRGAKTFLITAPSPSHGVSTVVHNLAKAMAKAGDRVLVVDANFRSSSQHLFFQQESQTGLATVLSGQNKLHEAIRETKVRGLDLLPSGPAPHRPTELLKSAAFDEALKELASLYDCVLLDAPSTNVAADALIAAASCEATILVVRAQKADRRQCSDAHDALVSAGGQVVGVVINDVPRRGNWETDQHSRVPHELPASSRVLAIGSERLR